MTGKAHFGGKRAAPFGSKRRKVRVIAKATQQRKKGGKVIIKDASLSVVEQAEHDIELGKDGAKWKHGYVPENAAAVALKAHRKPGSKGATKNSATIKRDAAKTAREAVPSSKRKSPNEQVRRANAARASGMTQRAQSRAVLGHHGYAEKPKGRAPSEQVGATHEKAPQHIYLSADERRKLSDPALQEHIAAHKGAAGRARSETHKANHENEITATKREQVRRKAAATRAAKAEGQTPKSDIEKAREKHDKGALGSLNPTELKAKMADPNTSAEDRRALKGEAARRVVESKAAVAEYEHALKTAPDELAKEGINAKDPDQAGRVFDTLERLAPRLKPHLERLRTSHAGRGVKKAVNVEEVLKLALHGTIVPLTTLGIGSLLASTLGISLGAG